MLTSDSPTKLRLPSFSDANNTHDMNAASIPIRLTGYINEAWPSTRSKLTLVFDPADWYPHNANYAVSLLDWILKRELTGPRETWPQIFFNSSDRGSEYNNRVYLEYLGLLVLKGVFVVVVAGRLPPGHT